MNSMVFFKLAEFNAGAIMLIRHIEDLSEEVKTESFFPGRP